MQVNEQDIASFLVGWLSDHLKREVATDSDFASLGLDSLDVVRLTDALAERLELDELSVDLVMDHPSINALAAHLATAKG